MGGLKVAKVAPHAGGIDLDSGPAYLAATRGLELSNFLPGRPGKLEVRGNLALTQIGGTAGSITGLWRQGTRVLAGRAASTYVWDANVPETAPAALASVLIGPSYIGYADSAYGVGGSGSGQTLLRWYLSGATETVTTNANAPVDGLAVTVHLDRLFVLGGSKPGTTSPMVKRSLWWTDPLAGAALPATVAAWSDDASGLVNGITFDGTESDYGVGLARISAGLVVLRRRSIDLLTGQTPANFSQRRVLAATGCTSPTSVVEYGGGCYYMSEDGLVWFDGVDSKVQSDRIGSVLLASFSDLEHAYVEVLPRDFLFVAVPSKYVGATAFRSLYHIPTGSWSTISHGNPWSSQDTMVAAVWGGEGNETVFAGPDTFAVGNVTVPS